MLGTLLVAASLCAALPAIGATASSAPDTQKAPATAPDRNAAGRLVGPEIWMCTLNTEGLIAKESDWPFVRKHLSGIKIYTHVSDKGPEPLLVDLAKLFRETGMQVAVECGGTLGYAPLDDTNGAESAKIQIRQDSRFLKAGGHYDVYDMDHPIRRLMNPDDREGGRPGFTLIQQCADQLTNYLQAMHRTYPDARFFILSNFPNWGFRGQPSYHATGPKRQSWGDYDEVIRTVLATCNRDRKEIVALTVDFPIDYLTGQRPSANPDLVKGIDWVARVRTLEDFVKANGLEFNLILNSERGGETSDEAFARDTLQMLDIYMKAGGKPTRYFVQSWYPHPKRITPESDPTTLTGLVKAVMLRTHPELAAEAAASKPELPH